MGKLSSHTHECPRCGMRRECGEANYQDECPYPIKTHCTKCWAQAVPRKCQETPLYLERRNQRKLEGGKILPAGVGRWHTSSLNHVSGPKIPPVWTCARWIVSIRRKAAPSAWVTTTKSPSSPLQPPNFEPSFSEIRTITRPWPTSTISAARDPNALCAVSKRNSAAGQPTMRYSSPQRRFSLRAEITIGRSSCSAAG